MTRPARILLVDDEVSIQRAVEPLLRSRGYDVDVAGTSRDAFAALHRQMPYLIGLYLGLPDGDGIDVCRQVRERADLPIIVLSARGR